MLDVNDPEVIKDRAIRAGKWVFLARLSQVFGGGILLLVLPYWLTPDALGIIAMVSTVLALGLLIQQAGFAEATIQGNEKIESMRDTAFWLNLAVSILLYLSLFALSPWISDFLNESRLTIPLRIAGFQIIFAGLTNVPLAWFQRTFRFQSFALSHLANSIVLIGVTLVLTSMGYGYWAFISGILGGAIARTLLVFILLDWMPGLRLERASGTYLLRFSAFVLFEMILGWFLVWFDNIVVARHLGSRSAGIYALAFQIATLAISLPCSGITGLTLPTFSRLQTNLPALRSSYLKGTGLIAAYVIPAGIGIYLLGDQVIRIVYPNQWQELGSILSVLGLYAGFGYLWILNTDVFKAIGKPEIMVKIYVFSVAVIVPVYWWSSQIGLLEFTIARSLVVVVGALPHMYYAMHYLQLKQSYLWTLIRAPLAASLVMAICVWGGVMVSENFLSIGRTNVFVVPGLVLVGLATYVTALWFLAPQLVRESYSLFMRSVVPRVP